MNKVRNYGKKLHTLKIFLKMAGGRMHSLHTPHPRAGHTANSSANFANSAIAKFELRFK